MRLITLPSLSSTTKVCTGHSDITLFRVGPTGPAPIWLLAWIPTPLGHRVPMPQVAYANAYAPLTPTLRQPLCRDINTHIKTLFHARTLTPHVRGPYAEPSTLHNHTNARTLTMNHVAASPETSFTHVTVNVAAHGLRMHGCTHA